MHSITELKLDNETTFREIFDEYQHPLYQFLLQKIGSEFQAREIVQLSFIKLWKYRHQLDPGIDISIQLFRIAKTVLIDEIRKIQTRDKHHKMIPETPHHSDDLLNNIAYKETRSKLARIVSLLPPKRREVFELSKIHCHSNREIAEILAISPKTVENHITLALRFIKPFFCFLVICYNLALLNIQA